MYGYLGAAGEQKLLPTRRCLSMDMQEGGALGLDPSSSEFLAIPCPHNGTAVHLCFMCNVLSRFDTLKRIFRILLFERVSCCPDRLIIPYIAETGFEFLILLPSFLSNAKITGAGLHFWQDFVFS